MSNLVSISSIMCSSLGGGGEGEGGGGEGEGGGVGGGNGGEGGGGNGGEGGGGGVVVVGGGGGESSDSTDCSEAITRLERQSKTTKRILQAHIKIRTKMRAARRDCTLHSSLGSVGKYRESNKSKKTTRGDRPETLARPTSNLSKKLRKNHKYGSSATRPRGPDVVAPA
jgi:hypothetical protein